MDMEAEVETAVEEPPDPDVVEKDPTGRYSRYKDVIGQGSSKKVYKAFDEEDGIEVAWSRISITGVSENSKNFERLCSEVKLLKSLQHKNIIKFFKAWVDTKQKKANIITEFFTSGNLRQYRLQHRKVNMKALKRWARQILEGLHYLHSHNPPIIHRDIKCDNIFINGNHGEVKIGDLGLATIIQQGDAHAHAHSFVGTFEFMAPEVYDEDYNELVDIYSFGMCMLEMVTCEYPYMECNSQAQIFKKVTSGIKPQSLSKVKDPEAKLFIEKCLVPAAERMSAKELLQDPFLEVDQLVGNNDNQARVVEEGLSVDIPANNGCLRPIEIYIKNVKAKLEDENAALLTLRLDVQNIRSDNIEFTFYLTTDTSISVALEMVKELKLANQHFVLLAELIDSSLMNIIPNWKPFVLLVDETRTSSGREPRETPIDNSGMPKEQEDTPFICFGNLFEDSNLLNIG